MKNATLPSMDSAGRVVIPRKVREQAGLLPGQGLEIACEEGSVQIRPAPLKVRIVQGEDGLPLLVAEQPVPSLTTQAVQATIDRIRAERGERPGK